MEFNNLLAEAVVLGLMFGVGVSLVVVVGLARIDWFYRAAFPIAGAWLLLPTKAYPAVTYFLLTAFEILAVLEFVRWRNNRRDFNGPSHGAATFTMRFMLLFIALIAAVCGVCVIAVKDINDVVSQLGSSVASSTLILVATWDMLTSRGAFARAAVETAALVASVGLWHFTAWFDIYETRSTNYSLTLAIHSPVLLIICDTIFGVMLAICTATMLALRCGESIGSKWHVKAVRCVAVPLIMVSVALGGYFYYRLTRPIPIPLTVLPDPNGHTYFARAGKPLYSVTEPDVDSATVAAITQFVTLHNESLSLLRRGLELECCTPLEWKEGSEYLDKEVDSIQYARATARLLQLEARMHATSNDYEQASHSSLDCVRLAHGMSRQGLLVHYLVGAAIEGVGIHELRKVAQQLDSPTASAAAVELLQIDDHRERAEDFVRRDELWSQVTFGWISRLQLAADDLFFWQPQFPYSNYLSIEQRNDAIRHLLITELAVHAFTLDHGTPPRLLADLVPQYLPRLPDDPYGRGPMRYRLAEDSPAVYSLGPDGDDDLGKGLEWADLFVNGDDGDLVLGILFKPAE